MTRPQRSDTAPTDRHSHGSTVAPTHICCGQRLRQQGVGAKQSQLSFTYCARCESLRWFRRDLPLPDDAAPPVGTEGLRAGVVGNEADASI